MSFTDVTENSVLDEILGSLGGINFPDPIFLSLHEDGSGAPNDDGTNFNEPVGNGYARISVPNSAAEWPAAVGGSKSNANPKSFPQATGVWGNITHAGIFTLVAGGVLLLILPLSVPKNILSGDTLTFAATDFLVTLD